MNILSILTGLATAVATILPGHGAVLTDLATEVENGAEHTVDSVIERIETTVNPQIEKIAEDIGIDVSPELQGLENTLKSDADAFVVGLVRAAFAKL